MKTRSRTIQSLVAATGMLAVLTTATVKGDDGDSVGIAQISDEVPASLQPISAAHLHPGGHIVEPVTFGGPTVMPVHSEWHKEYSECPGGGHGWPWGCDTGYGCDDYPRTKLGRWWREQSLRYLARNARESRTFNAHLLCKWGYFIPTGCGGEGCPPFGTYNRVYAVDPYYADPRDGGIYAAHATGVPMAVPLAPVVGYTYNYSWGLPASRLTPISRPLPPR